MMPIDQLAMSSYMQPSGSVRGDRGPQDSPSWSTNFAYSLSESQLLLAALYNVGGSKSTPSWRIFGNELVFKEGERPDKAAVISHTNAPYPRMSTRGIPSLLQESDLFQKILTGLLHLDGARSIGGWRNIPGISGLERAKTHVPRLVDCGPGPPEEVFPQSRHASLASVMPLAGQVKVSVVGQTNKLHGHPAFATAPTLGNQESGLRTNTVFNPLSATAAPSSELTDFQQVFSHSLLIIKANFNILACETIEDEVGTQKQSTEGICNRQVERDENDRNVVVQDTYSIYSKDEADLTQHNYGGDQRNAMNQGFYGAAELSELHERYGPQGVKRKRSPVLPSEAVVVASRILLEEVQEASLYPKGKKRKGGLSG